MGRILIVDDEADIRELVRINLELDGHQVATAGDGAEAMDAVRRMRPELVILDVMMPGVDGWEVLASIKAEPAPDLSRIPVVMLTARTDDVDRIRGGIEGAIRYITKPFSLAELREEVQLALEGDAEPVKRRRAQHQALEQLARLERGAASEPEARAPRPKLTKLEGPGEARSQHSRAPRVSPEAYETLSDKQRELLRAVSDTPTVQAAALELAVSRSNVYASLRRIARKLGVTSVPELVALARQGGLPVTEG